MKVLQILSLLVGAASAIRPRGPRFVVPRDLSSTATEVKLVTSTYTVTECATDAINCPASATVVLTSTTVVSTTTTICSTSPVPEASKSIPSGSVAIPSSSAALSGASSVSSPVPTSGVSTANSPPAMSLPVSEDTSEIHLSYFTGSQGFPPKTSLSADISISIIPGSTVESTVSIVQPTPSGSLSSIVASSSPSKGTSASDAVPTSGKSSASVSQSGPNTNTDIDATKISLTVTTSASQPTSDGYGPPSTTNAPASSTYVDTSVTQPAASSPSSAYGSPSAPAESDSTADSTIRVTSYFTRTLTSYLTRPTPSRRPTDTETNGIPISRPSSGTAIPSGTGYPYPSGTGNATFIPPKPTYSEVPINIGQIIGVGKSFIAAIVVALAFAHFA